MTAPEMRFQEPVYHDDNLAAHGDDYRDLIDLDPKGPQPRDEDLA